MLALLLVVPGVVPGGAAVAQSSTMRAVLDRVEQLEQRVRELEAQLYSGGAGAASARRQAAPAAPTRAVDLEVRMTALEQALRGVTGQVEESGYRSRELQQRLEQLINDVDRRLRELEQSLAAVRQPPPPASGLAPADQAAPPALSSPGTDPAAPRLTQPATPPPASSAAGGVLPAGSPEEQYRFATGLVRQRAFADAEQAFREFLERHPDDRLAPNAQYWLGETLYVRQKYEDAARTFLAGYQRYPDSDKASDSLLKLGITLNHMGQRNEACATFDELLRRLPQDERRLRPKAELERRNSNCN